MTRSVSSIARAWLGVALALATAACGPSPRPAEPLAPVLVIGIDGLEWSVLHPLLAAGKCPNLATLMQRGSFGKLGTFRPTHSPVVWTSIATGKSRKQHGILGFMDPQHELYSSSRRRGRALWNIADRYGLESNVFGWWVTWPVEKINGVMVSATSAGGKVTKNWKGALVPGIPEQVHPPELTEQVLAISEAAASPERVRQLAREKIFGLLPGDLDERERDLIDQTLWSIASDETYFQIAKAIMAERPAELTLLYLGGPDVAGHRFWRHYRPREFAWSGSSPAADAALACVLPNYYVWIDEMIGELVAAASDDTTVFVLSDHGMHATATQQPNRSFTSGEHQDAPPGVIIAAGPGIVKQDGYQSFLRSGTLPSRGSVYAVAPTLLGLLGIPPARDMLAPPIRELLTPAARKRIASLGVVESHDDGFREPTRVELPAESEQQFVERMIALGYVLAAAEPDEDSVLVDPDEFELSIDQEGAAPCR